MKRYTEIAPKAYCTSDEALVSALLTETAIEETILTGLCVSLNSRKVFNIMVSYYKEGQIHVCWTELDRQDPGPCEEIARHVESQTKTEVYKTIMSKAYNIICVCSNPATIALLANHKAVVTEMIGM